MYCQILLVVSGRESCSVSHARKGTDLAYLDCAIKQIGQGWRQVQWFLVKVSPIQPLRRIRSAAYVKACVSFGFGRLLAIFRL